MFFNICSMFSFILNTYIRSRMLFMFATEGHAAILIQGAADQQACIRPFTTIPGHISTSRAYAPEAQRSRRQVWFMRMCKDQQMTATGTTRNISVHATQRAVVCISEPVQGFSGKYREVLEFSACQSCIPAQRIGLIHVFVPLAYRIVGRFVITSRVVHIMDTQQQSALVEPSENLISWFRLIACL